MAIKRLIKPFVENITEASAACLVTMVQGNLLAITLSHWLLATQVGLAAGTATAAILLLWRSASAWMVATVLGVLTAIADFLVHAGQWVPVFLEALVTGVAAAVLSGLVSIAIRRVRGGTRLPAAGNERSGE